MNFDITPNAMGPNVQLHAKLEQSSIGEPRGSFSDRDPVVRQTVIEGTSVLAMNKPLALGQIDVPGSTRHFDIEVTATTLP